MVSGDETRWNEGESSQEFTRTIRMRMTPRATPCQCALRMRVCGAEMSEIRQSSRTTTVESSMKSEHNLYLAREDSPRRASQVCTFSCSLALLASIVH